MGKLDGKVALVTGANRGIGAGVARALARDGANLVLAARDVDSLEPVAVAARSRGVEVLSVATDVTDEARVASLFHQLRERFEWLDLVVNNAGAFDGGPIDELSIEAWDRVIAVNLRGPFLCTRAALKLMKRQRSGRIINIGSIASKRVRPYSAPYAASKHGVWGLTQVTALEGREYGVTCTCINPGNVRVERRLSDKAEDAEPMMSVDEIAEVVAFVAALPPHVELLEATVLPRDQLYVGRG
jgi:NAD(P)-dependent dehydrogenase (short-subunit alcohol dehydrogenase family)